MKRVLLSLALLLAACRTTTSPVEDGPGDIGAPDGSACVLSSDCAAELLCGYPIDAGCSATGVCVPEDILCSSDGPVVCGCDSTPIGLACIYGPGYAAAPIISVTPGCQPAPFDANFE